MAEPAPLDPFAPTADPAAYVPRDSTDRVLAWLLSQIRRDSGILVLSGPPGSGKTLLLRVLEQRLAGEFAALHVPYPLLPPDEMWTWLAASLGVPHVGTPRERFEREASRRAGTSAPVLLAVDSAESLPIATAEQLADVAAASAGAVRLVLAVTGGRAARAVVAALGRPATVVHLHDDMSVAETALYLETRLARAGVPAALRERFDAEAVALLHARAGGNPGALHGLADAVLCGRPLSPAGEEQAPSIPAERRHLRLVPRAPEREEAAPVGDGAAPGAAGGLRGVPLVAAGTVLATLCALWLGMDAGTRLGRALRAPAAVERQQPEPATEPAGERAEVPAPAPLMDEWPTDESATDGSAPPPAPTLVSINAFPWAEVYVDGELAGETPIADVPIAPGPHRLRLVFPDGRELDDPLEVEGERLSRSYR